MSQFNYYQAPPQAIFEDIKEKAIKLWNTYDDTYGYATEKIDRIKDIENVKDNAWYIVAMFDPINIEKLMLLVEEDTAEAIRTMLYEMNINYI